MKQLTWLFSLLAGALIVALACAPSSTPAPTPRQRTATPIRVALEREACPVTMPVPPDRVPEAVARTILAGSSHPELTRLSMTGNDAIWVTISENGVTQSVPRNGGIFTRFVTVPLVLGELTGEARRLDGSAPPANVSIQGGWTSGGPIWMFGVLFPVPGCWEITQRIEDNEHRFVVKVVK